MWGATNLNLFYDKVLKISIHAPRVGSDSWLYAIQESPYISIHAPRVGSDWYPGNADC